MADTEGTKAVIVRFPLDQLAALDERASKVGRSREETIRRMIKWALAQPLPRDRDKT